MTGRGFRHLIEGVFAGLNEDQFRRGRKGACQLRTVAHGGIDENERPDILRRSIGLVATGAMNTARSTAGTSRTNTSDLFLYPGMGQTHSGN